MTVPRSAAALLFAAALACPAARAVAAAPATGPATTAPAANLEPRVRALVARLGDRDPAKRDEAERELGSLGTAALDLLRAARDGRLPASSGGPTTTGPASAVALSADAVARLDAAIARILDDDESGPSRITLDFREAPLEEVLREFNKQARSELLAPQGDFGPPVKKKVTLRLDHATFFEALDALQKASGLTFQPQNDGWRAFPGQMNFGNEGKPFDQGAFRFRAGGSNFTRSVQYANNQRSTNFYFSFTAMAEPKLRMVEGAVPIFVDEARDDAGNDLTGAGDAGNAYNQGYGGFGGNLQLRMPKDPGKKIDLLRGRMKVSVVKSYQNIVIPDVLAGRAERNLEGTMLVFERADGDAQNSRQIAVRMSFNFNGNARTLNAVQRAMNRIKVTDSAGNTLDSQGWDQNNQNNQIRYTMRYAFNGNGDPKPPYTLRLDVAKDTKEIEIPFEFRDLEMP